jgi:hypothetical protein
VHNGSTLGFHAVWASTVGTDYLNILRKHGQHSSYLSQIGCKYKLLVCWGSSVPTVPFIGTHCSCWCDYVFNGISQVERSIWLMQQQQKSLTNVHGIT